MAVKVDGLAAALEERDAAEAILRWINSRRKIHELAKAGPHTEL